MKKRVVATFIVLVLLAVVLALASYMLDDKTMSGFVVNEGMISDPIDARVIIEDISARGNGFVASYRLEGFSPGSLVTVHYGLVDSREELLVDGTQEVVVGSLGDGAYKLALSNFDADARSLVLSVVIGETVLEDSVLLSENILTGRVIGSSDEVFRLNPFWYFAIFVGLLALLFYGLMAFKRARGRRAFIEKHRSSGFIRLDS